MLTRLAVRNLALLRDTEITFSDGFTVVTGETGAGKSLLVEALAFLGGGKVNPEIIRDGAKVLFVEGEFIHPGSGSLILRRELDDKGRSRAFIGERLTSIKNLNETAASLFDITSQRAFSQLLNPSKHLDFLDLFSGLRHQREELKRFHAEYNSLKRNINDLTQASEDFEQRHEWLLFQLEKIDEINPTPGELDELETEIHRIEHYEDLHRDGSHIIDLLTEGQNAIDGKLAEAERVLQKVAGVDPALSDIVGELENVRGAVKEVARRVSERCLNEDYDADQLEQLRERQHQLTGLIRKYGGSLAALIEYRDSLRGEMSKGNTCKEELSQLNAQRDELVNGWTKLARKVSKIRSRNAGKLEKLIVKSLAKLGVKAAQFEVQFIKRADPEGLLEENGERWRLDEAGAETAEFYLSTNPGLKPRPLVQVASGGELSRLLLALKEATPAVVGEATIILDEIDSGVSGRVARLVGYKLRELSSNRQMIAITHLPQIAGLADYHVKVNKQPMKGEMETELVELTGDDRIREIATMLSGGSVTESALDQAKNLVGTQEDEQL